MIQPAFIIRQNSLSDFDISYQQKINELLYYGIDPITFPEIWAPVDVFDIKRGLYMISNYGRLYSLATMRELCYLPANGYIHVALQCANGTRKTYSIHRIVAYTFIPKTQEDYELERDYINHKNLIRNCNFTWNLEYVTNEENIQHAIDNGAVGEDFSHEYSGLWGSGERTYGENNGMALWTEEQVHSLCRHVQDGKSYSEALILSGLEDTENNRFNLSHIVQGKRWKYISKDYDLKPRRQVDKSAYVIPVCELLQEGGYTTREIVEKLDIPGNNYQQKRIFVQGIKNRKYYTHISKHYNW